MKKIFFEVRNEKKYFYFKRGVTKKEEKFRKNKKIRQEKRERKGKTERKIGRSNSSK